VGSIARAPQLELEGGAPPLEGAPPAPAYAARGLAYIPGFIDAVEERELLDGIAALALKEAPYKEYTSRRRIASFGSVYDFSASELKPGPPIPAFLVGLREKAAQLLEVGVDAIPHALVTEYRPGTPLGWHRDTPEFGVIAGISLLGAARMRFRPYPPRKGAKTLHLDLAPRSAYILRDEARWAWQHAIAPTDELRYSITFRTIRAKMGSEQFSGNQ
jgi:alkylated DNA repair dioxygenase AlkB